MKFRVFSTLAGAGLVVFASAATAQTGSAPGASNSALELEEIVVTARRKDESIQDVPTSINAVSGEEISKLNITKFEDVASVVPGLNMSGGSAATGASASVRGINYEVNASGNNGTVEFYQNDAPIAAGNLFQAVYDIQQVELLRGPQGTLRGRASPSGSMTVTTRRPSLQDFGGNVSMTANNIGGWNVQGGVGIPIVSDVFAVRVAAAYDKNEANRVVSLHSPDDPSQKTKSGRVTLRYEPTDSVSAILTLQKTKLKRTAFDQVASLQSIIPGAAVNPGAPGATYSPPYVTANDRLSVQDGPRHVDQDFNNYNLQLQWAFLGQKLNYVGVRNEQDLLSRDSTDIGDYFSTDYQSFTKAYGQTASTLSYQTAHELRLSSEERIFGMFDYIVGVFTQKGHTPITLDLPSAIFDGLSPTPSGTGHIGFRNAVLFSNSKEVSYFGNITAHIGDKTELSAGARHIKYEAQSGMSINGSPLTAADYNASQSSNIFSVSGKYNFTENLMSYVTVGKSWRPGIAPIGDFSVVRTAQENAFINLPPEKSTSYELGLKATALDKRLRYNVAVFHQKFDNYPYRSSQGVWFANFPVSFFSQLSQFNFVAAVPVEVNGVEGDIAYQLTSKWDLSGSAAYAKSKIKNGFVPCNDYNPKDGVSDSGGLPPGFTAANLIAANGGEHVAGCTVNQAASSAPNVSGTITSEYHLPITNALDGFARGLVSLYGSSKNDVSNQYDDYKSYQLLNLYTGIRSSDGAWEVSVYGKNVTNTQRTLALASAGPLTTPYAITGNINAVPPSSPGLTNYFGVDRMTPPREFGLNVRYAFGSK